MTFLPLEGAPPEQRESGDAHHQRQGGRHCEGGGAHAQYPAPHIRSVVEVREGLLRLFYAEELAQRPPAFLHLVDQQPLFGDAPLDLLVVPVEDPYGVVFVLEPSIEGALPEDLLAHWALTALEGAEHQP